MSNKTIICIHGMGSSKASFAALALTALASRCNIRPIDLPGFGARCAEQVPENPLSSAAQEIAEKIDAIGGQNAILAGHSLGGAVALLAAKLARTQVFGIASIEGNLVADDCGMSRRLASAASEIDCEAIKVQAISDSANSSNTGVRDWARDLSKASVETLYRYSKQLVALSDSGELLDQFISGNYRKLYIHGDDYNGHPILNRLGAIPAEYIPGACHTNLIGDAPEANALALAKLLPAPLGAPR